MIFNIMIISHETWLPSSFLTIQNIRNEYQKFLEYLLTHFVWTLFIGIYMLSSEPDNIFALE